MEKNTSRSLVLGGAATLASVLGACDAHHVLHNEPPKVTLEEMDGTPIETLNDPDLARANGCTQAIVLPTSRGSILDGDEVFRARMSDRDGPSSLDANFYSVADQLQVDLTGGVNQEHSVSWDVRLTATGDTISRGTYQFGVISGDDGLCHDTRVCLFGAVIPGDSYDAGTNGVTPEAGCTTNAECGTDRYVGEAFCHEGNVGQNFRSFTCTDGSCESQLEVKVTPCDNGCLDGACVDAPEPVTPTASMTITYDNGAEIGNDLYSGGDVHFYMATSRAPSSFGAPTFSLTELRPGAPGPDNCFGVRNQEPNFTLVSDDGVTRTYNAFFDAARDLDCTPGSNQNEEQITATAIYPTTAENPHGYRVSDSLIMNSTD